LPNSGIVPQNIKTRFLGQELFGRLLDSYKIRQIKVQTFNLAVGLREIGFDLILSFIGFF